MEYEVGRKFCAGDAGQPGGGCLAEDQELHIK